MKIADIPSRSDPDVLYEIVFVDDEPVCNCDGYRFTSDCYHTTAAQLFWAMLQPVTVRRPA